MLRTFRKDKKALVVKEKMMQSATRPMSGPCTPISLPAHEAPNFAPGTVGLVVALSLGWGVAMGEWSVSVGGSRHVVLFLTFRQEITSGFRQSGTVDAVVAKDFLLASGDGVVVGKTDYLKPGMNAFLE